MKIIVMRCKYDLYKKEKNSLENLAEIISKNRYTKGLTVFLLANMMYVETALANTDKIDAAGGTILGIVRSFGYWICLIMCIVEIIKSLMQGDTRSISKIIAKYAIGFGSFYFLPWFFDIIRKVFA